MNPEASAILEHLHRVAAERNRRLADAPLAARVAAVKSYQHERFSRTYADLQNQARYARATQFFLDDLYGPHDFAERDDQFARIVPALVKLFPGEIVKTVLALAELHALSEELDSRMGESMTGAGIDARAYVGAWQGVGQAGARERQIVLMLAVGNALDRYTRNVLLRQSLKLMRGPARAAGLASLQGFLERGFDTFREMRGATEFLSTIATRERALAAMLFDVNLAAPTPGTAAALGQLP